MSKILLLDIESSPNTAYVWGLWKENIPLQRLIESSQVLCWSAKWLGSKEVLFDSIHNSRHKTMIKNIHKLMDEADAIVHYNGAKFDIPTLNKEFLLLGLPPPAPYKQIDLLQTMRSRFRFPSNKLDYVAERLGVGNKHETNFQLWIDCMNKDSTAWKTMEAYNKQDVLLLEKVYHKVLPWIKNHLNMSLFAEDGLACPTCGGRHYQRRGYNMTAAGKYQRYQCRDCGNWFRGNTNLKVNKSKMVNIT